LADPSTLLVRLYSPYANKSFNYAGYNNTQYDQLYNQHLRELDLTKRKFLVDWMTQNMLGNAPHLPLGYPVVSTAYSKARVSGLVPYGVESLGNIWSYLNASSLVNADTFNVAVVTGGNGDVAPGTYNFFTYTYRRTGLQSMLLNGVFDNLLKSRPDGSVVPSLASGWRIVNSTNIIVQLRNGVKWTDGQPVTASDVKFTFDYLAKTGQPAMLQPYISAVGSVAVLNSSSVQFVLKQPFAPFITNTLTQIPILPQHIWDGLVEKQGVKNPSDLKLTPDLFVGSGPWKLTRFDYGSQAVFDRNPDYYVQPHFKTIRFVYFMSEPVAVTALEQGQIDTLPSSQLLTPAQVTELGSYASTQVVKIPTWTYWHLHFNMRKLPGADKAFRLAVAHAINYDKIVSVAFGGDLVRGVGMIAPVNTAWVDMPLVTQMMKTIYSYNVTAAKKILSDAGYQWDSQGRLHYPERLMSNGLASVQSDNYKFTVAQNTVISTVPVPQMITIPQFSAVQELTQDQTVNLTTELDITKP